MRGNAIVLTVAQGLTVDVLQQRRIGVVVASWVECDANNRRSFMHPPAVDTKCVVMDLAGKQHSVRESFDDIAALLGAAEGEPR